MESVKNSEIIKENIAPKTLKIGVNDTINKMVITVIVIVTFIYSLCLFHANINCFEGCTMLCRIGIHNAIFNKSLICVMLLD